MYSHQNFYQKTTLAKHSPACTPPKNCVSDTNALKDACAPAKALCVCEKEIEFELLKNLVVMHKAFASMNIAVIGEGKTSEYLAQNLALAGHDVYVGLKDDDADTSGYFLEEYDNMYICEVEEAAHVADLIIIASAHADVRQLAYMLEDVRRKVILDYTNNPNDTEAEKMHTVNAIKSITGSQHVVKCYDCSNYGPVLRSFFGGETVDLLVAGSSKKAKEAARILANDMGFENCHDFGGHNTIMLLDEMTKSWAKYSSGQGNKSSVKSDK